MLTVPTIHSESIEEYALAVFEEWKLGQKGRDNGVLVVVVPRDRKMRIEVGYGLEGTLTDVAASRIVRNLMTPQFKVGDFDRGVEDGVAAIVAQLCALGVVRKGKARPEDQRPCDGRRIFDWGRKRQRFVVELEFRRILRWRRQLRRRWQLGRLVADSPQRSSGLLQLFQELLAELRDFRRHHELAVRLVRVALEVLLVIILGDVEGGRRRNLRHDRIAP